MSKNEEANAGMRALPPIAATQQYVVRIALTPSVFRSCPPESLAQALRVLATLPLQSVGIPSYAAWLDRVSGELAAQLPKRAPDDNTWGVARKAVNVFMVQALMNRQLDEEYRLASFEDAMEVPLDSEVVTHLQQFAKTPKESEEPALPVFNSIKRLDPETSAAYQSVASKMAGCFGVSRGRLDVLLWVINAGPQREAADVGGRR